MPISANPAPTLAQRFHTVIILILAFFVPLVVVPGALNNPFRTPKTLVMVICASLMLSIYLVRALRGLSVRVSTASSHRILLLLIVLNVFSMFYTKNDYYTTVAVIMNVTCIAIFYFVSLYMDDRGVFWLMICVSLAGFLVSLEAWLQFFRISAIFDSYPGNMIAGTVGNSNYLGAYFLFPLFASLGCIFLLRGKYRLMLVGLFLSIFSAFLFCRARAAWMGFFLVLPIFFLMLQKISNFSVRKHLRSKSLHIIGSVILLSLAVLLIFGLYPQGKWMPIYNNLTHAESLRLRVTKYFPASWHLFKENPLFGTGLWSFRNMVYESQAEIYKIDKSLFDDYQRPMPRRVHNEYLEILNDGGLIAASALTLFFVLIMAHGWTVIADEQVPMQSRIITAATFCSTMSVMIGALLFFPFRINTTLLNVVLMMGIMEGFYLRNRNLIERKALKKSFSYFSILPIALVIIIGLVWFGGIKPLKAELAYAEYGRALNSSRKEDAEKHILSAIARDPNNTVYLLHACQFYKNVRKDFRRAKDFIEKAIGCFNGDIALWQLYYEEGLLSFRLGSLYETKAAYERAVHYNPDFEDARRKLEEVNGLIKNHDSVLIKLR